MEDEKFTFKFETHLPIAKKEAFEWHKRPGMLERLSPPFVNMKLISKNSRLKLDDIAHFKLMLFSDIGLDAYFKITEYVEGESFTDVQVKGPFNFWQHHHNFKEVDSNNCVIEDEIIFRVPLDSFLGAMINSKIAKRLDHIFNYRKQVLLNDIDFASRYPQKKLHILMTGAGGLIGTALSTFLKTMGHLVVPITRQLQANEKAIFWDIENQMISQDDLEDFDAVIHLAGENVGGVWTDSKKEKIFKSRVHSTRLLVNTLNKLEKPPKTFICASGGNYYMQSKDSIEDDPEGRGFLTHVIKEWEEEACKYKHGRTTLMRTGVVLSPKGGMLKKLLRSYELGLGAKLGSGKNHLSWISIDDIVYQYYHILMTSSIEGPVNLTSPEAITSEQFSKSLAKTLKRPLFLKLPKGLIESIFGQMAKETILSDFIIKPKKLLESEGKFYYPNLEYALKHILGAY